MKVSITVVFILVLGFIALVMYGPGEWRHTKKSSTEARTQVVTGEGLDQPGAREARWRACVDELITAAEPAALAQSDVVLAALLNAHLADQASYHVEFNRFGDFLQIAAERGGQKLATAVNLGLVSQIMTADGHPPDGAGTLMFEPVQDTTGCISPYSMMEVTYKFEPVVPTPSQRHATFVAASAPTSCGGAAYSNLTSGTATYAATTYTATTYAATTCSGGQTVYIGGGARVPPPDCVAFPRDAVDDAVRFAGVGDLRVPAGFGQKVRDAVLVEVGGGR